MFYATFIRHNKALKFRVTGYTNSMIGRTHVSVSNIPAINISFAGRIYPIEHFFKNCKVHNIFAGWNVYSMGIHLPDFFIIKIIKKSLEYTYFRCFSDLGDNINTFPVSFREIKVKN